MNEYLVNGTKIAIIGGGPAGSFFALYFLKYAKERGIQPELTIYQGRNFDELGPKGCKGCAGILSTSLLRNLGELDLTIPEEIIQRKLSRYTVLSPYTSITISNPERDLQIISIYRGGGPRISDYGHHISFDGWLLGQAQQRGARVEYQSVSRIWAGQEAAIEVAGQKIDYSLVVLASGVNVKPIPVLGLEYVPPDTQIMTQDELYAGTDEVESRLGDGAFAFLIPHSGMIFGTLVPKGPFINVSVLSRREHPMSLTTFLGLDLVRSVLPGHYSHNCGCRPRAVVSSVRSYYSDRFVAVGDATVSRLYKDGIGSSLLAAREAARTVVEHGLTRLDFRRYYKPFRNSIDRDNRYGQLLFSINDRTKNSRTVLWAQQRLIADEQNNMRGSQHFTKAAWGMFTGSYSYRSIVHMTLNPASLAKLSLALSQESLVRLFRRQMVSPRRLFIGGKKILILGSGFGGIYVLRHLVPALNRNENVETTMVSNENFFLFSPLLHEVAMGRIETRHIAYPIRRLHWRDRFNFVQASVEKIDLTDRRIITSSGTLEFDYLVLALGIVANTSELDLTGENVFTLKTLQDSRLIRNHIIELFERASVDRDQEHRKQLLTFVVCGGGYTGVQLVTELRDFIFRNLLKFYRVETSSIRIILVEAESRIVSDLHAKLGTYVMKHLQRTGIEVRLRSRVTRIQGDSVRINNIETVPTNTLIWVAGVVASPQIAELNIEKDGIGRVLVNEYMEVPGMPGVYAVGDCAHFKDPESGQPIPPRAHTAVRQARVVAHNILAEIRGREKKFYRYANTVDAVSLGSSDAVLRFRGLRLYGFLARFIWLVGYSFLVTGTLNRTRIIMDWLLSLIFGRDTTFIRTTK